MISCDFENFLRTKFVGSRGKYQPGDMQHYKKHLTSWNILSAPYGIILNDSLLSKYKLNYRLLMMRSEPNYFVAVFLQS